MWNEISKCFFFNLDTFLFYSFEKNWFEFVFSLKTSLLHLQHQSSSLWMNLPTGRRWSRLQGGAVTISWSSTQQKLWRLLWTLGDRNPTLVHSTYAGTVERVCCFLGVHITGSDLQCQHSWSGKEGSAKTLLPESSQEKHLTKLLVSWLPGSMVLQVHSATEESSAGSLKHASWPLPIQCSCCIKRAERISYDPSHPGYKPSAVRRHVRTELMGSRRYLLTGIIF